MCEKWVSDLIGNDYKKWGCGKVFLACGTGRGKTRFALQTYCNYLITNGKQKILYLCNRKALKAQTKGLLDANLKKYVTAQSYQWLEDKINKGYKIERYDAYICDEAHYFLTDSAFNLNTDISYGFLKNITDAPVIFMTATWQSIFNHLSRDLQEEMLFYRLDTDYSYVEHLCFFGNRDVYGIIDDIINNTDDKAVYFCNSITRMQNVYNHYSPTMGKADTPELIEQSMLKYMDFRCSDYSYHWWAKRHSNPDALIESEDGGYTFEKRILISTKCIDNGIDFKDRKIRHIICDIFDLDSAIQCLGRKRVLDKDDRCNFYIRNYHSNEVNIFWKNTCDELNSAECFLQDRNAWVRMYGRYRGRNQKTIYYDFEKNDWTVNNLRFAKLSEDKKTIKSIKDKTVEYKNLIMEYLPGVEEETMKEIQKSRTKNIIELFIENNLYTILTKEKQTELVKLCNLRDRFNRPQKSIGLISRYLEENYKYMVTSKSVRVDGIPCRRWMIERV